MKYKLSYTGSLRTEMIHEGSGASINSDAPKDNHGKGEAFSPTDLSAVSLSSCMITVMGIHANKKGWGQLKISGSAEKVMQANPRRIKSISTDLSVGIERAHFTQEIQDELYKIAEDCPVALSLHPEIEQPLKISFYAY